MLSTPCTANSRGQLSGIAHAPDRERKLGRKALAFVLALLSASACGCQTTSRAQTVGPPGRMSQLVREEQAVSVDHVAEVWRLVWKAPPEPVCSAADPLWTTCGCSGFAFGEGGRLDLVRVRQGHEYDRLALTPFFDDETPTRGPRAVVQRWNVQSQDLEQGESEELASRVATRPPAKIMQLADYDHDGSATEFFLQTGTLPCGKEMGIAVGVSGRQGRLHAFGTALHPDRPLVMQRQQWYALRDAAGSIRVKDLPCGDHLRGTETELELGVTASGIRAVRREFACQENNQRGRLLSESIM